MTDRISTGFDELDLKIQGGYPIGSVILYTGIPGSGKTLASLKFLAEGLKNNEKGLIITTKHSYTEMIEFSKKLGFDFNEIFCVDCVNWKLKRMDKSHPSLSKYEVQNIADLNTILAVTIKACKDNPEIRRIVFDSPTSMLIYSTPPSEQVYRFFELLISFVKQTNRTLVFSLDRETHDKKTESVFEFLSDGLVELYTNGKSNHREVLIKFLSLTECDSSSFEFKLW